MRHPHEGTDPNHCMYSGTGHGKAFLVPFLSRIIQCSQKEDVRVLRDRTWQSLSCALLISNHPVFSGRRRACTQGQDMAKKDFLVPFLTRITQCSQKEVGAKPSICTSYSESSSVLRKKTGLSPSYALLILNHPVFSERRRG